MPATGYTWKGDGIAPAGPVYCLYIHCVGTESLHSLMLDSLKGGVRVDYHA